MERVKECVAGLVALASVACGAAPEREGAGTEATGEVTEPYAEAACGQVAADVSLTTPGTTFISPPIYGSASCVDSYVADVGMPATGTHRVEVWYNGSIPDNVVYPCNSMWVRAQLWARPVHFPPLPYTLHSDYPLLAGAPRTPTNCNAPAEFISIPQNFPLTQYRVVAQAAFILGLQPIRFGVY